MSRPSDPATASRAEPGWPLFVLTAFIAMAGTILLLSGSMWPVVLELLIIDGGIAGLWLIACAGIGGILLSLAQIRSQSSALNFATAAALGLGTISLLTLGLGLCGWLNRAGAIGIVVVGLIAAVWQVSNLKFQISNFKSPNWLWLIVIPPAAIAIVGAMVLPGMLWGDEPHGYDVLEYHLQVPREWYELGRIVPLKHNVFSYFPFNVEMHYLLAMHLKGGPWKGMYLAQLMHVGFVAMTVVAVYGIVAAQTARPKAAMLSAIVAATVPWMPMLGAVAYNEGGLLLFGTLAIGWALLSQGRIKVMLLAGALAGFACGTKLTAVPMVLLAVPVALFTLSLRERAGVRGRGESDVSVDREPPHPNPLPKGEGIRGCAAFILAGLVTFSPWLIRNTVWAGNPIFPEGMSVLGKAHFSDIQVERWQRAHSPRDDQRGVVPRIEVLWKQIIRNWRYGIIILPVVVIALALARRQKAAQFLGIILALQLLIWLGATHLQGRFFVLAVPIGAILIGLVQFTAWNAAVAFASIASAATASICLGTTIHKWVILAGMENYHLLLEQWLQHTTAAGPVVTENRPLVLAGEAQAFRYDKPMSQLTYRTVFDVDEIREPTANGFARAWFGGEPPANAAIIIFPDELRRFSSTYWTIAAPPSEWGNAPFAAPR